MNLNLRYRLTNQLPPIPDNESAQPLVPCSFGQMVVSLKIPLFAYTSFLFSLPRLCFRFRLFLKTVLVGY